MIRFAIVFNVLCCSFGDVSVFDASGLLLYKIKRVFLSTFLSFTFVSMCRNSCNIVVSLNEGSHKTMCSLPKLLDINP